MLTLTIGTPGPYTEGRRVDIYVLQHSPYAPDIKVPIGYSSIDHAGPRELLVRVGGRDLAFQELDGHGNGWIWREG